MLFALVHAGFNMIGIIIAFIMGMLLALTYIVGRRSLTPPLISHILINLLIKPRLLMFIIRVLKNCLIYKRSCSYRVSYFVTYRCTLEAEI
ncbi:CPBP family intramembrane glutamic endopeptidase [Sporolactobacillus pectinivorans]|uniref:CPBP family intramembrane glutamic endopeptidase n=1 Tax=Sporolactobacillus pectinivorans TaxID=1591408 RepID=UPI003B84AF68